MPYTKIRFPEQKVVKRLAKHAFATPIHTIHTGSAMTLAATQLLMFARAENSVLVILPTTLDTAQVLVILAPVLVTLDLDLVTLDLDPVILDLAPVILDLAPVILDLALDCALLTSTFAAISRIHSAPVTVL